MSEVSAPASRQVLLPPHQDEWRVVRHAVLADGNIAILQADADIIKADRSDREQYTVGELGRVTAAANARIVVLSAESAVEAARFPLLDPYPVFDRFPDGRWLVANARTLHGDNARLLTTEGANIRRIMLGDGIGHLQIDDLSRIWIGWFDEGVFGNHEWKYPGLKWPPSAHGIAAFDEHGALVANMSLTSIADCYALNVAGETAWSSTYTDFPIACIGGKFGAHTWPTSLSGCSAIAVDFPNVLAAGGYSEGGNRVVLLRLMEQGAKILGQWRLPFEVNTYDLQVDFIGGRGDELHVINDAVWHSWRVSDFVAVQES